LKQAFTIIELIFVIVIIGILAGVALPRLFSGISDAKLAKAKTEIATIRSGISSMYSKNILAGKSDECPKLEKDTTDDNLFEGVLAQPIKKEKGSVKWKLDSDDKDKTKYTLTIDNESTTFTYEKDTSKGCSFTCDSSDDLCQKLQ